MLGGVSIIASIIGTFAVKSKTGNVERALYQGLVVAGVLAAVAFFPVTYWMMDGLRFAGARLAGPSPGDHLPLRADRPRRHRAAVRHHRLLHVDALRPGQEDGRGVGDRPRDEHHPGPRVQGLQATALPALVIVLGILLARTSWPGIYGIGVAVMAQLSLTGLIVALDAFGPITDNAGGIAEMADMPEEVRNVTDPLDAVGNTTKAVTKGYAIGSAALAALVLFAAFKIELDAELPRRASARSCSSSTTRTCSSAC